MKKRIAYSLVLAGLAVAIPSSFASESLMTILAKITRASDGVTYKGKYVYSNDDNQALMEVTRISKPDGFTERHVTLSGTLQEIIRTDKGTWCLFPDAKKGYYKKGGIPTFGLRSFDPSSVEQFQKFYRVKMPRSERLIGREVDRVTFQPKDDIRYGQDLWVDRQTGLLLRSDLVDHKFKVIESRMFVDLRLASSKEFRVDIPTVAGEDFIWNFDQYGLDKTPVDRSMWNVGWVPDGFRKIEHTQTQGVNDDHEVEQIVFSDSLSKVSVFVRQGMQQDSDFISGLSQLGAVNVYSRVIGAYNVIIMGEVPERTVRAIGDSVVQTP